MYGATNAAVAALQLLLLQLQLLPPLLVLLCIAVW